MSEITLPDLVTIQIPKPFLDRWIVVGEGPDRLLGFKFEEFMGTYIFLGLIPDGTGTTPEWPKGSVNFITASNEVEAARRAVQDESTQA